MVTRYDGIATYPYERGLVWVRLDQPIIEQYRMGVDRALRAAYRQVVGE